EVHTLAQQPVVRRRWQPHGGRVGIAEPWRTFDVGHEAVRLLPELPELPPLEEDHVPGDERKHDENREDEFRLPRRCEYEFPGSGRHGATDLKERSSAERSHVSRPRPNNSFKASSNP